MPDHVERVAWERVAGVIVVTAAVTPEYLADLHATGMPIVLASHQSPALDVPAVAPGNRAGVQQAGTSPSSASTPRTSWPSRRWSVGRTRTAGESQPGDFLPIAEETGLIVPMGRSLITLACTQIRDWRAGGVLPTVIPVSLNVSHREFWQADLLGLLERALEACKLGPEWLTIEITEGVLMDNVNAARVRLEALHRFPIDALKIDASFVARLETDPRSRELVSTIIMMAHGLDIDVIAEGVETREQQQMLMDLGCQRAPGYLFARPLTPDQVAEFPPLHQEVPPSVGASPT